MYEITETATENFNLTIHVDGIPIPLTAGNLGLRYKAFSLPTADRSGHSEIRIRRFIALDRAALEKAVSQVYEQTLVPPVNASVVSYNKAENFTEVSASATGLAINPASLRQTLEKALIQGATEITLQRETLQPAVRTQDLREVIGVYTTRTTNSTDRNFNIRQASGALSGTKVLPGAEFSFFGTVGDTASSKSPYRIAGTLLNGQPSTGRGGGICQVSATLYCAVKQASLLVTERHLHSARVGYVSVEGEAMVNQGTHDFKFKNTLSEPVTVLFTYDNVNLTCFLFKSNEGGERYAGSGKG
jgi:vancomycin resistance protein YoaR